MVLPDDETVYDLSEHLDDCGGLLQADDARRPVLIILNGFETGRGFVLEDRQTLLGRANGCHIQIFEAGVSRRHALFDVAGDTVEIIDLKSRNGIFVNGERVERTFLADQDRISIGRRLSMKLAFLAHDERLLAEKMFDAAVHDPLTQLYNKRYFLGALERRLTTARPGDIRVCLLLIDLDYFKQLNDTHGHLAGDLALRHVSRIIASEVRNQDIACRYGGEEFVVLLQDADLAEAAQVAERIRAAVAARPLQAEGMLIPLAASIGAAAALETVGTADALISLADSRLYAAKRQGRNRVCITVD